MRASVIRQNGGALQSLINRVAGMHGKQIVVGVPEGKTHTVSENGKTYTMSMSLLANIHEFGSPSRNIPARPFLIKTLKDNQEKYVDLIKSNTWKMITRKLDPDVFLARLGMLAVRDVQAYMVNGQFKPLAEITIARKGSSKPLIDTGQLRQSITYQIERKK